LVAASHATHLPRAPVQFIFRIVQLIPIEGSVSKAGR
jgi:hypothetical protein